jgi:hypothetical protein
MIAVANSVTKLNSHTCKRIAPAALAGMFLALTPTVGWTALTTYYGNQAGWQAAVASFTTEDFLGQSGSYASSAVDVGDFSVSKGAGGTDSFHSFITSSIGTGMTSPTLGLRPGNDGSGATTILTFEFPIRAIAFPDYDMLFTHMVSVNNTGNDTTTLYAGVGGNDNNTYYFGITSDTPFTTLTIGTNSLNDAGQLDNVQYATELAGSAVPEPGTFVLGLTGLAGLGLLVWRRRRNSKS